MRPPAPCALNHINGSNTSGDLAAHDPREDHDKITKTIKKDDKHDGENKKPKIDEKSYFYIGV